MSEGALPPWERRDNFRVPPHQNIVDRINTYAVLTTDPGTEVHTAPNGKGVVDRRLPRGPGVFPVRVVQIAGSDGTSSAAATWTYDVYLPTGNPADAVTSGTKLTPAGAINLRNVSDGQRPVGKMIAGDNYGLAFYDGTTLILWDAGEKPDTAVGCTT